MRTRRRGRRRAGHAAVPVHGHTAAAGRDDPRPADPGGGRAGAGRRHLARRARGRRRRHRRRAGRRQPARSTSPSTGPSPASTRRGRRSRWSRPPPSSAPAPGRRRRSAARPRPPSAARRSGTSRAARSGGTTVPDGLRPVVQHRLRHPRRPTWPTPPSPLPPTTFGFGAEYDLGLPTRGRRRSRRPRTSPSGRRRPSARAGWRPARCTWPPWPPPWRRRLAGAPAADRPAQGPTTALDPATAATLKELTRGGGAHRHRHGGRASPASRSEARRARPRSASADPEPHPRLVHRVPGRPGLRRPGRGRRRRRPGGGAPGRPVPGRRPVSFTGARRHAAARQGGRPSQPVPGRGHRRRGHRRRRFTIPRENIQPASLDLRLGEVAYRIRCSFLPGPPAGRATGSRTSSSTSSTSTATASVLETNRPYLIPLKERLALPAGIRGKANPKSSTGRARRLHPGHHRRQRPLRRDRRRLHTAACTSRSCRSRSRSGCARTSRSTSCGCRSAAPSSPTTSCARSTRQQPLLFRDGEPVAGDELGRRRRPVPRPRPRAATPSGRVGYRARDNAPLLDMTQRRRPSTPTPFWEPVQARGRRPHRPHARSEFYLLMSDEAVHDPARRWPPR